MSKGEGRAALAFYGTNRSGKLDALNTAMYPQLADQLLAAAGVGVGPSYATRTLKDSMGITRNP
uniref:hypothetical protein n=1 Tax=Pseudomonas fluorescens TaxID=294 RepID=UPI00130E54D6|nr:hypothetical protein [Pseudomonas fluorescens]